MNKSFFWKDILFLGIIIVNVLLFYGGYEEFLTLPKGIHQWKSSMHFSIVLNYMEGHANFLHPAIHNLFNEDKTGKLVQEFPIFHYIASFFTSTPYMLKIIISLYTLFGLFMVYKMTKMLIRDYIASVFITLNLMLMPLVLYYGFNYMVDITSMLSGMIGVYYMERYIITHYKLDLGLSIFFIVLCGLLRLPVIIFPMSYLIYLIITKKIKTEIWYLLAGFLTIGVWYFYVLKVNTYYVSLPPETTYFFLDDYKKKEVWKIMRDFMIYQFGYSNTQYGTYLILLILLLLFPKHGNKKWLCINLISAILSFAYFIAWFSVFNVHDYYLCPIIPSFFLVLFNIVYILIQKEKKAAYFFLTVITIFNFLYSFSNIKYRLFQIQSIPKIGKYLMTDFELGIYWWIEKEDKEIWNTIRKISPFNGSNLLEKHQIKKGDTTLCLFDNSPTYVLTLLDLKGWSNYQDISYQTNPNNFEKIKNYVRKGAKYLICRGKSSITNNVKYDSVLTKHPVLEIDSIRIYKISHLKYY